MNRNAGRRIPVVAVIVAALLGACTSHEDPTWNPRSAATYLDRREPWWANWPAARRDQQTFCVSCHTALPYALARPVLRDPESPPSEGERRLLESVTRRVRLWPSIAPYYSDQAAASRGTEAVLNALILSNNDSQHGHLSTDTRAAFEDMWALQQSSGANRGAWPWIEFYAEPWEGFDSAFYGAVLAALAVGTAPDNYRSEAAIQSGLGLLKEYLNGSYAAQSLLNRIMILLASAHLPGLLDPSRQQILIKEIWSDQQPDGGWCTGTLVGAWRRWDGTAQVRQSDGFATGLITLTLQQIGIAHDDPRLRRATSWLVANQNSWNGRWVAYSLNRSRNPLLGYAADFMDDAATAFAVLALTQPDARVPLDATTQARPTP